MMRINIAGKTMPATARIARIWRDCGGRFGDYGVVHIGWHYWILVEGADGILRPATSAHFWRWMSAARVAQSLWSARLVGHSLGFKSHGPCSAPEFREIDDPPGIFDARPHMAQIVESEPHPWRFS